MVCIFNSSYVTVGVLSRHAQTTNILYSIEKETL